MAQTQDGLEAFLSAHRPIPSRGRFAVGQRLGDWMVRAFVGQGGFGEVYRVVSERHGGEGALKILVKAGREAIFRQEVTLLQAIDGGHFLRLLDVGEADGRPFHVTELLEPAPLPSEPSAVAAFMLQVAEGVRQLHTLGWAHRDLKRQNLLQRTDGTLVIGDVGLAARLGSLETRAVGTCGISAPEQFAGGAVTPPLDIHALGVLIEQCFRANPPKPWELLILQTTSSLPERRLATIDDFIAALRRL